MEENKKINVVDLFSGCGGFSCGLKQAGFNIVLGVDNDDIALNTFKKNHKGASVLSADLSNNTDVKKTVSALKNKKIAIIGSGPPCQGFSLTGTRNAKDPRNKLFFSVFEVAKKLKPKIVIIENVPGIKSLFNGKAKSQIVETYNDLGYNVTYKVLFAPDFGVPQIRKRIFFIGTRKDIPKFEFPKPKIKNQKYISCSDAISDLPERKKNIGSEIDGYTKQPDTKYQKKMRKNSSKLYNHVASNHTDYVKKVISMVPEGGNYKDLPEGVGTSRNFNEAWTRYHSKKPAKTIDTGHRNHFHYIHNRIPTVRENARLQSFPDNFIFFGNKTNQNKQVGNAVPPLLAFNIGKSLKKCLEN